MSELETQQGEVQTLVPSAHPPSVRSNCPDCKATLVLLRVISGRGGAEYWTMRCTRCGGIHLDIVQTAPEPVLA
jgi:hypothetical protein